MTAHACATSQAQAALSRARQASASNGGLPGPVMWLDNATTMQLAWMATAGARRSGPNSFHAWQAPGRCALRGQHGVKVTTLMQVAKAAVGSWTRMRDLRLCQFEEQLHLHIEVRPAPQACHPSRSYRRESAFPVSWTTLEHHQQAQRSPSRPSRVHTCD